MKDFLIQHQQTSVEENNDGTQNHRRAPEYSAQKKRDNLRSEPLADKKHAFSSGIT
jgi:hypothetical protein